MLTEGRVRKKTLAREGECRCRYFTVGQLQSLEEQCLCPDPIPHLLRVQMGVWEVRI